MRTFLNATVVVCPEATCDGLCLQKRDMSDACFCDEICELYGDCCFDYWPLCKNETLVLKSENRWIRDKLKCRSIAGKRCDVAIKMVVECPNKYANQVTVRKCEDTAVPYRFPVMGKRGYIYGNQYCAECHGESFDDLLPFEISLKCPNESEIMQLFQNLTEDEDKTWILLEGKCVHNVTIPPEMDITHVRFCSINTFLDDVCEFDERRHSESQFEAIWEACHSYQGIVSTKYDPFYQTYRSTNILHKNSHCALCDGVDPLRYNVTCPQILSRRKRQQCFIGPSDVIGPSFTVLLDFGRDFTMHFPEVVISCPEGHTYVTDSGSCEPIICAEGYELHQGTCFREHKYVNDGSSLSLRVTFYSPTDSDSEVTEKLHQGLFEEFNLTGNFTYSIRSEVTSDANITKVFYRGSLQIPIPELSLIILKLSLAFSNIPEVSNVAYEANISTEEGKIQCQEESVRRKFSFSFGDVSWNISSPFDALPPQASSVEIEIETFTSEGDVQISNSRRGVSLTGKWNAHVCSDSRSDCPYVLVSETRIKEKNESRLVLKGGKIFHQGDFFTSGNQTFACTEYQKNYTESSTDIFTLLPGYDRVHYYMTVVGLSTSIAGLLLTFVVYCLLKPLRTIPGKILMNLVLSLLLAQFFFLFGSDKRQWPTFCVVNAALEHYLWLVSFVWMNVISLDLAKTFMSPNIVSSEDRGSSLLFGYGLYSWGLPFLLVGACLCLDLFNVITDEQMKYASKLACFLSGYHGMLYAFVLPLTIIMAINVVCFIGVLFILSKASSLEKKIQKNRMKRNQMFLFAKLLPITGLAWIFGVVASLGKIPVLWHPFIVLNSLQGLFVFFAFVFNARVRGLLKAKLLRRSPWNNDGTATITTRY